MNTEQRSPARQSSHAQAVPTGNGWRTFGIVVITIAITTAVGYWIVTVYLFPESFEPVVLSTGEQQRLERKFARLSGQVTSSPGALEPEAYTEDGASREIRFSEKEINALLANNTDLASRLAIDLSDNLASARLLIHLDPHQSLDTCDHFTCLTSFVIKNILEFLFLGFWRDNLLFFINHA